uniref:Uncharacterized protein n=1 Tax=Parastrongyloides trichosuri TaxID=131310 RepID=A0A0N4Z800_PARTI
MALIYASAVNKRIGSSGLTGHSSSHSHSKNGKKKCSLQHHHGRCSDDLKDDPINYLLISHKNQRSNEEYLVNRDSRNRVHIRSISVCKEHPFEKFDKCPKIRESLSTSSSSRNCSKDSRDDSICCRKHSKFKHSSNKMSVASVSNFKKNSYGGHIKALKKEISSRKVSVPPVSNLQKNLIKDYDTHFQSGSLFSLKSNGKLDIPRKHTINESLSQQFDGIIENDDQEMKKQFIDKKLSNSRKCDIRRKSLSYDNLKSYLENHDDQTTDEKSNEISAFQRMKNKFKKWKL